ncbi:MAG: hypothetical protein RLY31_1944 [Bacteroidota bacterium]
MALCKINDMNPVIEQTKDFLVSELQLPLPETELQDDTPLLSSRLIDSISTLLLVEFLEKTFRISFHPHEVNNDNLDTLAAIAAFVAHKQQPRATAG